MSSWKTGSDMRRRGQVSAQSGFSLIEVMVALTIFSLAIIASISLQTENVRAVGAIEERALAQIVAENQIAEVMAGVIPVRLGTAAGEEVLAGQTWRWLRIISATEQAGVVRVEVRVTGAGTTELANLVAFQGVRG